jgi:hypothetical protein
MELQRRRRYDLMYTKAKELDRKENDVIRTDGIDDSQGNMIIDQKQVLKSSTTELIDRKPEYGTGKSRRRPQRPSHLTQ